MGSCVSTQNANIKLDLDSSLGPIAAASRPIPHLSDEILVAILTYVAQIEPIWSIHDVPSLDYEYVSYQERLGWTRLCGVCRHWRTVLLNFAPLWASVVFHLPPRPAALALSRAKGAPLSMRVPHTAVLVREGRIVTWKKRITRAKRSEQPSNRERLLALSLIHSCRMGQFFAEDLMAQDFQAIFRQGTFNDLRVLVLKCSRSWRAPFSADIGQVRIVAPRVEQAHLSVGFQIVHDDRPGLRLDLPALLDLEISASMSTIPWVADIDKLEWIPPLIRNAPKLRSLVLDLSTHFPVDWKRLFGAEPARLEALRAIRLSGTPTIHQDQLFSCVSTHIPPHVSFAVDAVWPTMEPDGSQLMSAYGNIIARSIRVHPLDSLILSRGTQPFHDIFDLCVFSHDELPGPYLMVANFLYNACTRSRYSAALSARMNLECAGDALRAFANLMPAPNAIRYLVLDEHVTDSWAESLHVFLRACLFDVVTVHCTYFYNPIAHDHGSTTTPCTTLLRVLGQCPAQPDTHQAHQQSPGQHTTDLCALRVPERASVDEQVGASLHLERCLPRLETLVISMGITDPPKEKKKRHHPNLQPVVDAVRMWWVEVVQVLTLRQSSGLRVHKLHIVGGWASEEVHRATAEMDAKMFAQAVDLVDEIVDERSVWLEFTYDSSRDFTQSFSSPRRAAVIPANGAW